MSQHNRANVLYLHVEHFEIHFFSSLSKCAISSIASLRLLTANITTVWPETTWEKVEDFSVLQWTAVDKVCTSPNSEDARRSSQNLCLWLERKKSRDLCSTLCDQHTHLARNKLDCSKSHFAQKCTADRASTAQDASMRACSKFDLSGREVAARSYALLRICHSFFEQHYDGPRVSP